MRPQPAWTVLAERVRGLLAPAVALLGSSLLLCCLVTLPDIVVGWPSLSSTDARLPGWSGVGLIVAVAAAALSILACTRLGSAPPLAFGTTTAVLGLALSGDITSGGQAVLALVLLAMGVGGLFGAGLCSLEELPPQLARATLVGWLLPWAGGWGAVGWLALRGRSSDETRLGLHPPALAVAAGAVLLLLWAVATLTLEPRRDPDPHRVGWENAWAALGAVVVGGGSLVMLIGFQPDLAAFWGRPVVLLAAAVVAAGLVVCALAMPDPAARPAFVAVVVASAVGPACIDALLLVSAEESGSLSTWVLALLVVAGVAGALAGWRRPRGGMTTGLLVMAVAVAGGWVMPADERLMSAAAAPLCIGVAAAVAAGIRLAARSRMRLRFVSLAGLSGLLLGQIAAAPIVWALGAEITGSADARAGGRVLLGLTFALSIVAAAACAVLPTDLDDLGSLDQQPPGFNRGRELIRGGPRSRPRAPCARWPRRREMQTRRNG